MTQPSQNAFDRLLSGGLKFSQSQKTTTGKRRRSAADQQAKYSTCPVCQGSYPTAFIESHVSDCLNRSAQKSNQAHTPANSKPRLTPSATQRHDSGTPAQAAASTAAAPKQSRANTPSSAQQQPSAAQLLQQKSIIEADGTTKTNAYAILAAGQAAQVPFEAHMFLEALSDGSWACHWWSEGAACPKQGLEPAWSASVMVDLPTPKATASSSSSSSREPDRPVTGKTKMRLHLATNLPSGFGTRLDWDNPLLASNYRPQQQQQHVVLPGQATGQSSQADAAAAVPRWRGEKGPLISALQKCIRRGLAASATRIALCLLKDPAMSLHLLRRLSIICLEDGLLHPQLPLVVWAMLAHGKGYEIGGSLANALLAITYQIAAVGFRDFLPEPEQVRGPAAAIYQAPRTWDAVNAALPAASPESLLVKCILIRAGFGGMTGDTDMLLRYAGLWLARFRGITLPPPQLPQQQAAAPMQQQPPPPLPQQASAVQQQQQQTAQPPPVVAHPQQQQQQQQQIAQPLPVATHPQQQQHNPGALCPSLPGRKGPECFAAAAATTDPWVLLLREAYAGLQAPGSAGAAAETCHVTCVAPLQRNDLPVAAIDFHVARSLTDYLLQHPAVQSAIRAVCSSKTAAATAAALYSGPGGPEQVIRCTMWLFRSSLNRKGWLQDCYLLPAERDKVSQAAGYAQQVMCMELDALQQDKAETRARRAQLMPVWKAMATLADAWAKDFISKRLF